MSGASKGSNVEERRRNQEEHEVFKEGIHDLRVGVIQNSLPMKLRKKLGMVKPSSVTAPTACTSGNMDEEFTKVFDLI